MARTEMTRYRARDLATVPGALSLVRIPLAAAFVLTARRSAAWGTGILLAAGLSDVLDGWYARRFGMTSATGAIIDPITDKLFVAAAAGSLLAARKLPPQALALMVTREIGELPLLFWAARRRPRRVPPRANVLGKIATALQFAAITAAVVRSKLVRPVAVASGVAGLLAGLGYWMRELRRPHRSLPSAS